MNIDQLDYERIVKASIEKRGYLSIDKIRKELSVIYKEEKVKRGNFDFSVDDVVGILEGIGYKVVLHPIAYESILEISEKYKYSTAHYDIIIAEIKARLSQIKNLNFNVNYYSNNILITMQVEGSVDYISYNLYLNPKGA